MLEQLLEEREQRLLGPVQILQHDRPRRRAEARIGEHGHEVRPSRRGDAPPHLAQEAKLRIAPDERARRQCRPILPRAEHAFDRRDLDLPHALRVDRSRRAVPDPGARQLAGERAGEDLAVLRVLFETSSDYDGASGDERLRPLEITRYYFAGIYPDAKRETWAAVRARGRDLVPEGKCRADGAVGVILVCGGNAEHGPDGVPD